MNKKQTIKRFCKLTEEVMRKRFAFTEAADCLCEEPWLDDENLLHRLNLSSSTSEAVIQFIEDAVAEKLASK